MNPAGHDGWKRRNMQVTTWRIRRTRSSELQSGESIGQVGSFCTHEPLHTSTDARPVWRSSARELGQSNLFRKTSRKRHAASAWGALSAGAVGAQGVNGAGLDQGFPTLKVEELQAGVSLFLRGMAASPS
jgi:hypothetical protein